MSIVELFKTAATPPLSYGLRGRLELANSGWLLLTVPNAVMRGAFDAMAVEGAELPRGPGGDVRAHISVMTADEVEQVGASQVSERGHMFSYTLGPLREITPKTGENSRAWAIDVRSPELERLRRSYGLSSLPRDGEYPFHITVAVRRRNVLGNNPTAKLSAPRRRHVFKSPSAEPAGSRVVKLSQWLEQTSQHFFGYPEVDNVANAGVSARNVVNGLSQRYTSRPAAIARGLDIDTARTRKTAKESESTPQHGSTTPSLRQAIARAVRRVREPKSEAQAEAGNYRKGHVHMHGLAIAIETPRGKSRNPAWPPLKNAYGYIKRTEGADGDHVDIFLGDHPEVELVYVVDQVDPKTRAFDETKTMMGFESQQQARQAYRDNYSPGWKGLGQITPLTMQQFKAWLKDGDMSQPVAEQMIKVAETPLLMIGDAVSLRLVR